MLTGWDADRYQRQFGFVAAFGGDLLELLDPVPQEVVLDLGCGTGELAAEIRRRGARVLGLDSDPAMVAAGNIQAILEALAAAMAEARPGRPAKLQRQMAADRDG